MGNRGQIGDPSDVSDEEWAFVSPYLALCREDSEQRDCPLPAMFNALRYIVRTGSQWSYMTNNLPRGQWFINRPSAGCALDVSRP